MYNIEDSDTFIAYVLYKKFPVCICSLWLAALAELFLFLCSICDLAAYGPLAIRSAVTWPFQRRQSGSCFYVGLWPPAWRLLSLPLALTILFVAAAVPLHHRTTTVVVMYVLGYYFLR
jgi:hypothetical protein